MGRQARRGAALQLPSLNRRPPCISPLPHLQRVAVADVHRNVVHGRQVEGRVIAQPDVHCRRERAAGGGVAHVLVCSQAGDPPPRSELSQA